MDGKKENTFSLLDQLPQKVNEEERLANAWGASDDYFVDAIDLKDT